MQNITSESPDPAGTYTYRDHRSWTVSSRLELIRGRIYPLPRAEHMQHQYAVTAIASALHRHIRGHGFVFPGPLDVLLTDDNDYENAQTVLQPDITVVCDSSKLKPRGCFGAPDLVVEITSPSTVKRDLHEKLRLYEEFGVREYWVVQPRDRTLVVHSPGPDGRYVPSRLITMGDTIPSRIFPDLQIDSESMFTDVVEEPEGWYGENVVRIG